MKLSKKIFIVIACMIAALVVIMATFASLLALFPIDTPRSEALKEMRDGLVTEEGKVVFRVHYSSGKIMSETEVVVDERGTPLNHGEGKRWTPSGYLEEISSWKRGVLDGRFVHYYENDDSRLEGQYCNGRECGEWISYNRTGEILSKVRRNDTDEAGGK